jgi:glycosyltransferase involved in cell wall biosynthesis
VVTLLPTVRCSGAIPIELDCFMPHCDHPVLPSFTEGLPIMVLESCSVGILPVVATAVGGSPDAVADGIDGYPVLPGDPTALARRILDMLEMGDAHKEMGLRGQDRIRAEFTFETQAESYQQLFREIVGPKPSVTAGLGAEAARPR